MRKVLAGRWLQAKVLGGGNPRWKSPGVANQVKDWTGREADVQQKVRKRRVLSKSPVDLEDRTGNR